MFLIVYKSMVRVSEMIDDVETAAVQRWVLGARNDYGMDGTDSGSTETCKLGDDGGGRWEEGVGRRWRMQQKSLTGFDGFRFESRA